MATLQEHIDLAAPTVLTFLSQLGSDLTDPLFLFELGIVCGIVFISHLIQKRLQQFYLARTSKETNVGWTQTLALEMLSLSPPLIALFLLSVAMGIMASFTENLGIYKFSIKLTLIWLSWLIISRTIWNPFVRWVVSITLIPLLIISACGLSHPVIEYLDSLGFPLAGVHVSIFLMIKGLLIATCLFWLAQFICQRMTALLQRQRQIDAEARNLIEKIFQLFLYTTAVFITLDFLGIDLTYLVIASGAIGIGIGLGLQKIAANFISGLLILCEQNVKVGHVIEFPGIDSRRGVITYLGSRAAVIDTWDGKKLLVPNEELLTKALVNWTFYDRQLRTDLPIKVSLDSDFEKAKAMMLEAALKHPLCSKTQPPVCFLDKFTDNGAQFLLRFWVDDMTVQQGVQSDLLFKIAKLFNQEGIRFPPPPILSQASPS